jgi:signal recognition particle receptor subunit alpha
VASTGFFGKITSAFQQITGNKVLTHDDMGPILVNFAKALMDKNVAQDVANDICRQVETSLLDQKTASFTSVNTTIKNTLARSIQNLMTPKKNIDILKEALAYKQRGQVYSVAFIGVNGVGKSTSLAKVAYYLKTQGNLKVMLAGCDNFRSGAIE